MADTYYTVQLVLSINDKDTGTPVAYEFKDCTQARVNELKQQAWTTGIVVKHTPVCAELISPFLLKSFFIIVQDKKYSL